MVKPKLKTVTVISTTINGHTEYISGHSIRFDGKYIPQFSTDPASAKEFESNDIYSTNEEYANWYLTNVFNSYYRVYNIVNIEIPATPVHQAKPKADALIIFLLIILSSSFFGCAMMKRGDGCPSTDQNKLNKFANRPMKA